MSKFVIVGTIDAVPGQRDRVIATLKEHRTRCFRDEQGVVSFDIMTANDNETSIYVHEIYEDVAAFEAHFAADSFKVWQKETAGLVAGLNVHKSTLVE